MFFISSSFRSQIPLEGSWIDVGLSQSHFLLLIMRVSDPVYSAGPGWAAAEPGLNCGTRPPNFVRLQWRAQPGLNFNISMFCRSGALHVNKQLFGGGSAGVASPYSAMGFIVFRIPYKGLRLQYYTRWIFERHSCNWPFLTESSFFQWSYYFLRIRTQEYGRGR